MTCRNIPVATASSRGCDDTHIEYAHSQYANEALKFVVGPMPLSEFLDKLLPVVTDATIPSVVDAFAEVPTDATDEKGIYESLVYCLNKVVDGISRCPGFAFHVTATRSDRAPDLPCVKPEVCMYADGDHEKTKAASDLVSTHLGLAHVAIQVRAKDKPDFFTDPPREVDPKEHNFFSNIDDTAEDLGQHVHYAAEVLARQYRTCFFSISLFGGKARLIRWDRAGAVVTEAFDIKEKPEYLCEFLWRYSHAGDYERGFDPTATPASEEEMALFEEVVTRHVKLQLDLPEVPQDEASRARLEEAIAEHYEPGNVFRIMVLEKGFNSAEEVHAYLVSRPVVSPWKVTGRTTRGYWAVSTETHKIAFLKDTWRYNVDRRHGMRRRHQ